MTDLLRATALSSLTTGGESDKLLSVPLEFSIGVKSINECPECQRLWREYSSVTIEHIRLEGKLKIAVLRRELEAIAELTRATEKAAKARSLAHQAIDKHEVSEHGQADAAVAQ